MCELLQVFTKLSNYTFYQSESNKMYRQVSNIRRTLVGNKIVDHSDVVGASPVGAAPTTSSFSTYIYRLSKDNCKTRWESFKLCDLVRLILETLR